MSGDGVPTGCRRNSTTAARCADSNMIRRQLAADGGGMAEPSLVLDELETLEVYGDTAVGWDEHTPVNETVDEEGNPGSGRRGFGVPDLRAHEPARLRPPGRGAAAHPPQAQQRHPGNRESANPTNWNGRPGSSNRDGFVVVRDLLDEEHLATFRRGSARVLRQILEVPGLGQRKYVTESGRLPHRYSYGTASASVRCSTRRSGPPW